MSPDAVSEFAFGETSLSSLDVDEAPNRISKMAIACLLLALFSIISLIAPGMVFLCWIAVILGAIAAIRIQFTEELGGGGFALAAVGIGLTTALWGITARMQNDASTYETAGGFAKTFLDHISDGDLLQALELKKNEADRQVTGTALDVVYGEQGSENFDEMRRFRELVVNQELMKSGPDASWELKKGISIERSSVDATEVVVQMENKQEKESFLVFVKLLRSTNIYVDNPKAGMWKVVSHSISGE